MAGNAISNPSSPASASATVNSATQVTITYGVIRDNGSTLFPLVGTGTNTGDITDSTGTSVSLSYSGTLLKAGGTVVVTGSFTQGNTYTFNIRARSAAGVSAYTTTTGVIPNPTPPPVLPPPVAPPPVVPPKVPPALPPVAPPPVAPPVFFCFANIACAPIQPQLQSYSAGYLSYGTTILSRTGSHVRVENIKKGDLIRKSFKANSKEIQEFDDLLSSDSFTKVLGIHHKIEKSFYEINRFLQLTGDHFILANREGNWIFMKSRDLKKNDIILDEKNNEIIIDSVALINKQIMSVSIEVEPNDSFYASNVAVYNQK